MAAFAPAAASWPRKARLEAAPQPAEARATGGAAGRAAIGSAANVSRGWRHRRRRYCWRLWRKRSRHRAHAGERILVKHARRAALGGGVGRQARGAPRGAGALAGVGTPTTRAAGAHAARAARPVLLVARPALWAASPELSSALAARPASPAAVAERRAGRAGDVADDGPVRGDTGREAEAARVRVALGVCSRS